MDVVLMETGKHLPTGVQLNVKEFSPTNVSFEMSYVHSGAV